MTPAQFRNALQRVADDAWPGAGVEVSVQVWRPDGQCPHCQVALERPRHHETGAPGATYRRAFELSGGPVRTPHSVHECGKPPYVG